MPHVKTSITFPEDLLEQAKELSDNLSALVTEALRNYIRGKNLEKAEVAFGSWEERGGDSVDIVDALRKEERDFAKRSG